MKAQDINLSELMIFQPDQGKIMLGKERLLVIRNEAWSVLQSLMYDRVGESLTQSLMFQFGYRSGFADYEFISKLFEYDTEADKLASGPVMHMWEGIVHVEPTHMAFDRQRDEFLFQGIWRNSYEAENHLRLRGIAANPVCYSLTGYASGWCTAFWQQKQLLAIETSCVGRGDEYCQFEIKCIDEWGAEAEPWKNALSASDKSVSRELQTVIHHQQQALMDISTPIIPITDDIVVIPLIGAIDSHRASHVIDTLLQHISKARVQVAIMDITGVPIIDTQIANILIQVAQSARLLGASVIITGIRPEIAQTIIGLGINLTGIITRGTLQSGIAYALGSNGALK